MSIVLALSVAGSIATTTSAATLQDGGNDPAEAAQPPTAAAVGTPDEALIRAGRRVFVNCGVCHSLDKDGAHGAGPNLWGILGSRAASKPDFSYSDALAGSEVVWSDENLSRFVENPATFLPGTFMAFVGVAKPEDRAALIAFLRSKTTEQ